MTIESRTVVASGIGKGDCLEKGKRKYSEVAKIFHNLSIHKQFLKVTSYCHWLCTTIKLSEPLRSDHV